MTERKNNYIPLRSAFVEGVLRGLAAPYSAFRPVRISIRVDEDTVASSYRSASEDAENIRAYFERAIGRAKRESSTVAAK